MGLLQSCTKPSIYSERVLGHKEALNACPFSGWVIGETHIFISKLTHWGRDKMAAVSQTTLSNAFFLNENIRISIKISLKFLPKGPINNNSALVQIMAWRRSGDKSLSEPMMVNLLTHICVTRPQWVKSSLIQMRVCYLFGAKPLSNPILDCSQLDTGERISVNFKSKYKQFRWGICVWIHPLQNHCDFISASMW